MRILHLSNHCGRTGNGIVNVAVDLACAQAADGHVVAFASASGEYCALLQEFSVRFFDVDQRRRSVRGVIGATLGLHQAIREFAPDVIHAHMITGAVLARALKYVFRFALVTTVHNEFQRTAILMGVGDRVIAISDAVAEALAKRGLPRRRLRVVRNGPLGSPRRPDHASIPPAPVGHPSIVTVAGLNHRKGIADLIDAFTLLAPRHASVNLYIVGDGPQRKEFMERADRSPAGSRIFFTGFVADPRAYMLSADVFVLASHQEPFGLVLAEAREAHCAIVATDVGGIPEALDAGAAGILVAPHNSEGLAIAIERLLDSPEERQALQSRAASHLEPFFLSRVNRETLEVYTELVGIVGHGERERVLG